MATLSLQEAYDLPRTQAASELKFGAYAVLDATGTLELFETLSRVAQPAQWKTYRWGMAQLSPAVQMALRGVKVDQQARAAVAKTLAAESTAMASAICDHPLIREYWTVQVCRTDKCPKAATKTGRHNWTRAPRGGEKLEPSEQTCKACGCPRLVLAAFNPASPEAVKHVLYECIGLTPQVNKEGNWTVDGDALERLKKDGRAGYMTRDGMRAKNRRKVEGVEDLIDALVNARDLAKQGQFLNAVLSKTGRFHSNFNVNAPWTGRWSSSKDSFQRGGNAQNIGERHRYVFVPDLDRKMFYADLKTAESMVVAYLSGDEAYLEAHKSDVHTFVARLVWPHLPWNGDIKKDKAIAKSMRPEWDNVEGHDYRFQAKAIQHGSNFGMSPLAIAIQKHVPQRQAQIAQDAYFAAFPHIREWQLVQKALVEDQRPIVNPFGRMVQLLGRPLDPHTWKQALAFPPQSCVGEVLNIGLTRLWLNSDPGTVELLAQVHDAVLGQYPNDLQAETEALWALKHHMRVPFQVTDYRGVERTCIIPVELATGFNWGHEGPNNPRGLREVQ